MITANKARMIVLLTTPPKDTKLTVMLQKPILIIIIADCWAKNRYRVTFRCGNILQVFDSDPKTCNIVA